LIAGLGEVLLDNISLMSWYWGVLLVCSLKIDNELFPVFPELNNGGECNCLYKSILGGLGVSA
jgi:hypothetical protein